MATHGRIAMILSAQINYQLEWDIDPTIELFFDAMPTKKDYNFVYEERDGTYRAENDEGLGDFLHWKGPHNEGGFSGHVFTITMKDGTTRQLKGPWSSNSSWVNSMFPDRNPLIEATFCALSNWRDYQGNPTYSRVSGVATIRLCCQLLNLPEMRSDEFRWFLRETKLQQCERDPKLTFRAERLRKILAFPI
jgi:hypothetical protein